MNDSMNESFSQRKSEMRFSDSLLHLEYVILAVSLTSICVVTIIGNVLVLVSFILEKKLRTLSNYFILSLAVSDTMIATFAMPLFTLYVLNGEWTLGKVVCDMWLAQDYMCSCASSMNLLMISFDRYLSVISPLRYRARRTGKLVAAMISCVWIYSFMIFPPWIYSWQYIEGIRTVPDDDCYVQFLETNPYLTIVTTIVAYYIPLSVMGFFYFRIWRKTVKRKKSVGGITPTEAPCSNESSCSEKGIEKYIPNSLKRAARNLQTRKESDIQSVKDEEVHPMAPVSLQADITLDDSETINTHKPETCLDQIQVTECLSASKKNKSDSKVPLRVNSLNSASGKQDKAGRMLATILSAYIIAATPYNVVVLIKCLDHTQTLVPDAMWLFFYFLFYVNSTMNPICYALANAQFRQTYWKILKCSWKRRPEYRGSAEKNRSLQSSLLK